MTSYKDKFASQAEHLADVSAHENVACGMTSQGIYKALECFKLRQFDFERSSARNGIY